MNILELQNITKNYGEKNIFNDYNLEIKSGEFLMIIGQSGRGKTTLLNILNLLEDFDKGKLLYKGNTIKNKVLYYRNQVTYLSQNPLLIKYKTVEENINIVQYFKEKDLNKEREVDKFLEEFEILDIKKNMVSTISGGEAQKVSLIKALIKESECIFCDEPTAALDEANEEFIMKKLKEENQKGKTIIMVTHNMDLLKYATRVIEI